MREYCDDYVVETGSYGGVLKGSASACRIYWCAIWERDKEYSPKSMSPAWAGRWIMDFNYFEMRTKGEVVEENGKIEELVKRAKAMIGLRRYADARLSAS